jgi:cytochrome c-type biogenesis protein
MTLPQLASPSHHSPPPSSTPPLEGAPRGGRRPPRGALAAILGGIAAMLALFAFGLVLIPRFQAANPPTPLQRSDADRVAMDDLYLDLTLVTPRFLESRKLERYLGDRDPAAVLPVLVGLNTHTGTIEHMHHLPHRLGLIGPNGQRYPSLGEPIVLSQHHNAYLVLFPARDQQGATFLEQESGVLAIEAREVGDTPLRRFEWQLPLPDADSALEATSWASRLALALALLAALLVVLSPCALELSLYYSAIISCTVTEGERAALASGGDPDDPDRRRLLAIGRRRVIGNLASFVAGFTLLYAASGATVGLIGQGVRQPLGEYGEWFQIFGGVLILYFALRVAGVDHWLRALLRRGGERARGPHRLDGAQQDRSPLARALAWPGNALAALRRRGQAPARAGHLMRARDSFLVGMGLSSACLTCMGGAVLYPLLVYAGITSWYSGLVTLTLYSLGIALPMLFIALGFVRIRLSLSRKLGFHRALRTVSAVLLTAIGLMILLGYERIITDVAFGLLAEVSQWTATTSAAAPLG